MIFEDFSAASEKNGGWETDIHLCKDTFISAHAPNKNSHMKPTEVVGGEKTQTSWAVKKLLSWLTAQQLHPFLE